MIPHRPVSGNDPARPEVEQRFRTLVESIPGVAAYMDVVRLDDPGHSNPVYISPQIEVMLGYPRDAWLSDDELWLRVIHPDDARADDEVRCGRSRELRHRSSPSTG